MRKQNKVKLNNIIDELSFFLWKEYSSRFKNLSDKEDRHLFFLARILAQLKHIYGEVEEEKVIAFPKKETLS